ncbi:hypothetical protein Y032_0144g2436 [Ancylostoma ceylanicum]|uniref:Uncharacterized protein n=1 Tax=Ancylostoma ceylanicum TaxID=53326 RepID=A0A016T1U1_9BILA|nr:hypothetical protein Y032_0144g2436 [Ancylostoma ceylanicum]
MSSSNPSDYFVLVVMALIGVVLAYWYYLEKARKDEAPQDQMHESERKYDLPVDKVKSYPLDERTDLKPTSKKQESTQGTQEDSEGRLTEDNKKSSVVILEEKIDFELVPIINGCTRS